LLDCVKGEAYLLTDDQDVGYISKQEWHVCIKDECILLLYLKGLNIARREHFLSYQSCARSLSARHRSRLTLYCIDQDGRLIE
jgi:hypothetical protein